MTVFELINAYLKVDQMITAFSLFFFLLVLPKTLVILVSLVLPCLRYPHSH